MKLSWKLFAAFYFPLHFAVGSFYAADRVLEWLDYCRDKYDWSPYCVEWEILLLSDFFIYSGVGLIALSCVLPLLLLARQKKIIETRIFN